MKNWHVRGDRKAILFVPLLLIFHYYVEGYSFGVDDHVLQIPLLKLSINPDLFPADLLRSVFPNQFTYFYKLFGLLLPSNSTLEIQYFIGYLLSFGFVLYFFIKIAETLTSDKKSAYLAAIILASGYYPTAPWAYFDPFFSHRTFAFPFFLASIYLFLQGRYLLSIFLVGIMWNIHGLHAFHLTFIFLFSLLIKVKIIGWRKVLGYSFLVFISALPMILWKVSSFQSFSSLESGRKIIGMLAGNQLFPLSWHWNTPIRVGAFLLFLTLVLKSPHLEKMGYWIKGELRIFFSAILLMCIAGFLFIEVFPLQIAIEAQFFRSTVFFYLLSLPLVTHYLLCKIQRGDIWTKIMVLISVAAFISREVEFIILPLLYFLSEDFIPAVGRSVELRKTLSGFFIAVSLIFGLNGMGLLGTTLFRLNLLTETTLFFFTISFGLISLFFIFRKTGQTQKIDPLLLAVLGIGIITGLIFSVFTGTSKTALQDPDWSEIQVWSKEHTQEDALFLTPVYLSGYRVYSERGVVGEWYDGYWGPFVSQDLSLKWWERMKDYGITEENYQKRKSVYNALREEDFQEIGKKYGATYVITEKPKSLNLEEIFENRRFVLYSLP
jgi:hypothetical protein